MRPGDASQLTGLAPTTDGSLADPELRSSLLRTDPVAIDDVCRRRPAARIATAAAWPVRLDAMEIADAGVVHGANATLGTVNGVHRGTRLPGRVPPSEPADARILPALPVERSQLAAWHAWSREFDRISGQERFRADDFVAWIERNLVGGEADQRRRSRRV
jgi:hypothetical protein